MGSSRTSLACGGYKVKAKLGYEVIGTVNVMVVEA